MASLKWKHRGGAQADAFSGARGYASGRNLRVAIDESGLRYAAIGSDNRVRVWSTQNGQLQQQLTPPRHLTARYSCIRFAPLFQKKKTSTRQQQHGSNLLILGTESGGLFLWNIQQGKVDKVLKASEGHTSKIHDIIFVSSSVILSCDDDGFVIEWNQDKVSKKWKAHKGPVYRMCLSGDQSTLATASSDIRLWDLDSKRALQSHTGHSSPVHSLCFTDKEATHILSAATADRYINVWTGKQKRKHNPAVSVMVAPDETSFVGSNLHIPSDTDDGQVHCFGVLGEGRQLALWQLFLQPKSKNIDSAQKSTTQRRTRRRVAGKTGASSSASESSAQGNESEEPVSRVMVQFKSSLPGAAILHAHFIDLGQLLIVRGSSLKPTFEILNYWNEETSSLKTLLTLRNEGKQDSSSQKSSKSQDQEPLDMEVETPDSGKKADVSVLDMASASNVRAPRRGVAQMGVQEDNGRIASQTLHERLLSLQEGEGGDANSSKAGADIPRAGSIHSVLMQALHTKDQERLDSCLAVTDERIILETVDRLPTSFVLPFLEVVVDKFRAKPNRAPVLTGWIRRILIRHATYLMTVPNLSSSLGPLYHCVEQRLGAYKKLTKLSGRLDLVLGQINAKNHTQRIALQTEEALIMDEEDDDDLSSSDEESSDEMMIDAQKDEASSGEESDASSDEDDSSDASSSSEEEDEEED